MNNNSNHGLSIQVPELRKQYRQFPAALCNDVLKAKNIQKCLGMLKSNYIEHKLI